MGGKDVIYVKQRHSSSLQHADVQKRLKEMADKRFLDGNGQNGMASEQVYQNEKVWYIFVYAKMCYLSTVLKYNFIIYFSSSL